MESVVGLLIELIDEISNGLIVDEAKDPSDGDQQLFVPDGNVGILQIEILSFDRGNEMTVEMHADACGLMCGQADEDLSIRFDSFLNELQRN